MCMILPDVIKASVGSLGDTVVPNDTVIDELKAIANERNIESEDISIAMAIYMLGFSSYNGFN